MEEEEGIEPDCDNCRLPPLLPENELALKIYNYATSNFVRDTGALPLVFEALGLKMTRRQVELLLKKLILIHGIYIEHRKDEYQAQKEWETLKKMH